MKERPIIFSGEMVRAILEGRKTQTRRVVKSAVPEGHYIDMCHHVKTGWAFWKKDGPCTCTPVRCPYGIDERLWVRERGELLSWAYKHDPISEEDLYEVAGWRFSDGAVKEFKTYDSPLAEWDGQCLGEQKPSIHMPRWASRITLEITDVRVERVQDITEEDAKAEGVEPVRYDPEGDCWTARPDVHRSAFEFLWGEIHGWEGQSRAKHHWQKNPWVWVIKFKQQKESRHGTQDTGAEAGSTDSGDGV